MYFFIRQPVDPTIQGPNKFEVGSRSRSMRYFSWYKIIKWVA